ncbi:hypothetical protein [Anaerobium acetethylicum]|uniref:Uncharacterized protein n=1 Tax=Anaerobium acetethylicum TaxID=1619234 RepID=A0A1D3TY94_9FIRM|nr:hypothetical protein [Anaerobium acetethylicum]SCP99388.1 hypothetical protein SAMN05421730_10405 [Anaerobium acetethylicum]
MDEIYQIIEERIRQAGCMLDIRGCDIYAEIADFAEDKEDGTYIFMSKPSDNVVFEYKIDVMADNLNLSYIDINSPEGSCHIDFDN